MVFKHITWIYTALALILASFIGLQAGAEVKTTSPDPKQLEVPAVDAKQIKAKDEVNRPAWLSELSVTTKEVYDSNIFGTDVNRSGAFPKIANVSSWMTSVTPKVAINFLPLLNVDKADKTLQALSLSYAPEVVRYYDAASENYEAHCVAIQTKGKVESFSYSLDNAFTYIDGNTTSPQYQTFSGFGSAIPRERRNQIQDRAKLVLRNDWENVFVRGVASAIYIDLMSEHYDNSSTAGRPGWQNWVDRYDVNGGVDIGYKITKDFAAVLGYRHGSQYQENFEWAAGAASSNNDYERILAGFEGKPLKWLKLDLMAGPSFHHYDPNVMSVGHAKQITQSYFDASATAEITANDTLTLNAKQWQWVSSTGVSSYEDKTYGAAYKHKWLKEFSTSFGVLVQNWHYDAPLIRDDWLYTYSFGAQYMVNRHVTLSADYSYSRGENGVDENTASGREYERNLVSLGLKAAF